MSITKKLAVVGSAVLVLGAAAFAEVEVKPYGAVQYRLRFQHDLAMPDEGDSYDRLRYTHRLCWRTGTRVKVDDQLSLQFQFGNDWGAAEDVNWAANNSPFGRVGTQNFYTHLAFAKWDPGFMFVEAGIIGLNSQGTLDLLANSLGNGRYANAGWNGWGDANNSIIGLKVGAPIVQGDVNVGVEVAHSIITQRGKSLSATATGNPPSMLFDVQVPVDLGAFKLAPQFTMVANRNYNRTIEAGDHEILAGLGGSFKVNDQISLNFNGAFGMVSNENSQVGAYGSGYTDTSVTGGNNSWTGNAAEDTDFAHYNSQGILVGVGATIRNLGPGNLQIALNYNRSEDKESDDGAYDQIYTDIRYPIRLHKNFVFTPRWRTYTYMFTNDDMQLDNRFELILEGSF